MAAASRVLARFKICHVLKALQAGEPISMYGFCWRSSVVAFSLFDFLLKSHGRPSEESTTVRSSAKPGTRCFHLPSLISFVMRGGLYTSETVNLCIARRRSRA